MTESSPITTRLMMSFPTAWRLSYSFCTSSRSNFALAHSNTLPSCDSNIATSPSCQQCNHCHTVVTNYLATYTTGSLLKDQYAYKPTDSTTCTLADHTYRIWILLETNQYGRYVIPVIDFSKAFDTVNHSVLARKLLALQVPLFWYNGRVISYQSNAGDYRVGQKTGATLYFPNI